MKILLISANNLKSPYPVYPLGLDYVAGSISPEHEVHILDMMDFREIEFLGSAIKDISPDIIGISLRNIDNTDSRNIKSFIDEYKKIISQARINSEAIIILGGSGFTIFPAEIMEALDADLGVIGEGEKFGPLINLIQNNGDITSLPGIIKKGSKIKIPDPVGSNFSRHLPSRSPSLDFYLKRGGMLNLQTKRGCTFNCIYCTYPYIEGKTLRLIPPIEVAKTARALEDAGAKYLFITDSALNCSYSHSMEIARAFKKMGVSIPWGAFFAPTRPPADYYCLMADAGLTHVEFGTESLSDRMLKNYCKPFNTDDVHASHEQALNAGLYVAHYLLPGGPGEDHDTLSETIKNSDKLKRSVFFNFCGIRIYPNTKLYDIALKEGLITMDQNLLEPVFYISPKISIDEIAKIIDEHSAGKSNWVTGSGSKKTARLLKRMYDQGHSGPLWEYLIQ